MADKHLSLKPKQISDDAWWYETSKGVEVVVQIPARIGEDKAIFGGIYVIPWKQIRAALSRKDKA
jgi:hypothetical protein